MTHNPKEEARGEKINIFSFQYKRKRPRAAQERKLGDTLRTTWSYTVVAMVEAVVPAAQAAVGRQEGPEDKSIT